MGPGDAAAPDGQLLQGPIGQVAADPAAGPAGDSGVGANLGLSSAQATRKRPRGPESSASFTFLPTPDSDGVLRVHSHRDKQLSSRTEVDVVHPL